MRGVGVVWLVFTLAGCALPPAGTLVPGSGAAVIAPPELTERIVEIVARQEPRVIAWLGTRFPGNYQIRLADQPMRWNEVMHCAKHDDWLLPPRAVIRIGPDALNERLPPFSFEASLVHELVHLHAEGVWARLPPLVEEGVADRIALVLCGVVAADAERPAPSSETLLSLLTWDEEQCRQRKGAAVHEGAVWLGAALLRSSTPPELLEPESEPEPAAQRTCSSGVK